MVVIADAVIVSSLIAPLVAGFARGLVREAISLAAWAAAFWLGMDMFSSLSISLSAYIESESIREIIAFSLVFAGLFAVIHFAGLVASKILSFTGLGIIDRLFGGLFGFMKGCLLASAIVILINASQLGENKLVRGSVLLPTAVVWIAKVSAFLPDDYSKYIKQAQEALEVKAEQSKVLAEQQKSEK